jgi:hypothetical protein
VTTHDSQHRDIAISADLPGAPDAPMVGPQTVYVAGLQGPLTGVVSLPQAGQIWIAYEWQDRPAQRITLWQQGGTTQPINPGWNSFVVGQGDEIEWTLSSPANTVKIAWQYA